MEFKYTACDKDGKRITASASADAAHILISRLKNQGLTPLRVTEIKRRKKIRESFSWSRHHVSGKEIAVVTRQLASILHAGILLTEALKTIAEDQENHVLRRILEQIADDINAGANFSGALIRYPKLFSPAYIAMVRSGEESGHLDRTLAGLAKYLEDYLRMKDKMQSAMLYPVFLSCFLVFVVAIIVFFLIPKFSALFTNAGVKLPGLTIVVVGVSQFLLKNALFIVIGVVLLVQLFYFLLKIKKIRFLFDSLQLEIPTFGKVLKKALMARFARTFSILLASGVRVVMALPIASGVFSNLFLQRVLEKIKDDVVGGVTITEAIKQHLVFPRTMVKMVEVGERTGKLDEMLERSADYYDTEVEIFLDNLSKVIEPIFIILVGCVVLVVLVALYLPIFNIAKAVRG